MSKRYSPVVPPTHKRPRRSKRQALIISGRRSPGSCWSWKTNFPLLFVPRYSPLGVPAQRFPWESTAKAVIHGNPSPDSRPYAVALWRWRSMCTAAAGWPTHSEPSPEGAILTVCAEGNPGSRRSRQRLLAASSQFTPVLLMAHRTPRKSRWIAQTDSDESPSASVHDSQCGYPSQRASPAPFVPIQIDPSWSSNTRPYRAYRQPARLSNDLPTRGGAPG